MTYVKRNLKNIEIIFKANVVSVVRLCILYMQALDP